MTSHLQPAFRLMEARLHTGQLLQPHILSTAEHVGTATQLGRTTFVSNDTVQLGDPGRCPPGGTTMFVVLDESASVTAGGGNDPLSRRHAETALAIGHVADACRCRRDLVSLVPFDLGSAGHVAPQPLTAQGVRRLHRGLQRLSDGWGLTSEFGPALTDVETHMGRGRSVAVVVFSDFLLTDANPTAVLNRLRILPGYVHAVVLGAQPPSVLVADPNIAVTRLTPSSPPGEAARAVFEGLTRYRTTTQPGSAAHRHHHENPHSEGELIA